MSPEEREAQAARRFWTLGLIRLGGALLVLLGVVIASGAWPPLPVWLGYAMVVLGFLDLAVITRAIARRWRSPDR